MDLTTQRRLLNALTAGFVAVAVGAIYWSASSSSVSEVELNSDSSRSGSRSASRRVDNESSGGSSSADAVVNYSMPLAQSLYDPPPPPRPKPTPVVRPPKPVVVKRANLDWTLQGTIIDDEKSVAILADRDGKTDIRGVGEEVELIPAGVLVRKIDSDQVTLDVDGKKSTLRLEQSFQSGGGGNPNRANRRRNR